MILADGQSVVWASRLLGRPLPERVTGIDLFERLLELADRDHLRIYLLGRRPEVLDECSAASGSGSPPSSSPVRPHGYFAKEERPRSRPTSADPRGHAVPGHDLAEEGDLPRPYGDELDVPVLHGVGGSFDVLAGVTKRAPLAWQRSAWSGLPPAPGAASPVAALPVTNSVFIALDAEGASHADAGVHGFARSRGAHAVHAAGAGGPGSRP